MKIRTDFVTNSSSSSFSVVLTITDLNGKKYSYSEWPIDEEGGEVQFEGDLKRIVKSKSVSELVKKLLNAVKGLEYEDEEYDEYEYQCKQDINKKRKAFAARVEKNISSVSDIAKVCVRRDYMAWGEFADAIQFNDAPLQKLAHKACETEGEAQEAALKEMIAYINTPAGKDRQGHAFACDFKDIRYKWECRNEDALDFAKRLCNYYDPSTSEGREIDEIDLVNKKRTRYAEFDLY